MIVLAARAVTLYALWGAWRTRNYPLRGTLRDAYGREWQWRVTYMRAQRVMNDPSYPPAHSFRLSS